MDETAFVRGQKIILLIFKYLECGFYYGFGNFAERIWVNWRNYTTDFKTSVMRIPIPILFLLVNFVNNYTTDFKSLYGAFYLRIRVIL